MRKKGKTPLDKNHQMSLAGKLPPYGRAFGGQDNAQKFLAVSLVSRADNRELSLMERV